MNVTMASEPNACTFDYFAWSQAFLSYYGRPCDVGSERTPEVVSGGRRAE